MGSLTEEADIESIKFEDCICLMHMIGLCDSSLRKKLAEGEPVLQRFNLVLEAHVQAKLSVHSTSAQVNKTKSSHSSKQNKEKKSQPRERESQWL